MNIIDIDNIHECSKIKNNKTPYGNERINLMIKYLEWQSYYSSDETLQPLMIAFFINTISPEDIIYAELKNWYLAQSQPKIYQISMNINNNSLPTEKLNIIKNIYEDIYYVSAEVIHILKQDNKYFIGSDIDAHKRQLNLDEVRHVLSLIQDKDYFLN